jgi:uncharacterized membrane protein
MRTPANIARHPIHPMLVPIPIGLWIFALVCDLVYVFGSGAGAWATVALYCMVGGLIGALAAAIFGFVDLLSLPPEPKRIAVWHMAINLTIVVLYVLNVWLRLTSTEVPRGAIWLSIIAVALLVVSGWLGGHMVYVHGVAVDTEPTGSSGAKR